MVDKLKKMSPQLRVYIIIVALSALAAGLSGGVLSNYFKDAYQVTAEQRGLIEFPRELPGVITIFVIALLAGFSDIKIAMFSNILGIIGVLVLGLFTPSYSLMLIFIFIHSMGSHMAMPLRDAIGMDLIKGGNTGKRHLLVQNDMMLQDNIAGAVGWCAFDYNTHFQFGSGDRICYHGVMDMFRIPKFASYVYKSQSDQDYVLEPVTLWARGEKGEFEGSSFLPLTVLSNCEICRRRGQMVKSRDTSRWFISCV